MSPRPAAGIVFFSEDNFADPSGATGLEVIVLTAVCRLAAAALAATAAYALSRGVRPAEPPDPTDAMGRHAERRVLDALPPDAPGLGAFRAWVRAQPRAAATALDAEPPAGHPHLLRSAAEAAARGDPLPPALALAARGTDPDRFPHAAARRAFLQAHGAALDALADHPAAAAYQRELDAAAADRAWWAFAEDDPVGLLLWSAVPRPDLRAYYRENRDWLAEVLVQLAPAPDGNPGAGGSAERVLADAVTTAARFRNSRDVAREYGADGFLTLMAHADVVDAAVNGRGLPLDEVLEVAYANPDEMAAGRPEAVADTLYEAATRHPVVWRAARCFPKTLRLWRDLPSDAGGLLDRYAADGVAGFLYAEFPDHLPQAAAALARFGDLGFYVLTTHGGHLSLNQKRFRDLLAAYGARIVPYVARFGSRGVEQAADDPGFLDKYFEPDGTPKEKEWWTAVPILGGPADVARNLAKGYPCEAAELGWAAADVADGALLVATLGTSSVVTALKQGGKGGLRAMTAAEVRAEVAAIGRQAAGAAGRGSRESARAAFRAGRLASLLARSAAAGGRLAARSAHAVAVGGRVVLRGMDTVVRAARRARDAWAAVPEARRRLVYRALLAVGLAIARTDRTDRTAPAPGELQRQVADGLARFADQFYQDLGQRLADAVEKALGVPAPEGPVWTRSVNWVLATVAAAAGAWLVWPRRGGVRHA